MKKKYKKQATENNSNKNQKIMIKYEQYIDYLSDSVVSDAYNPDRKYYNVKDLIEGITEDYSSNITYRLPSETSQRKWINDFVFTFIKNELNGEKKKNSIDYDMVIRACHKRHAQKELSRLTQNTYDIMYQEKKDDDFDENYPYAVMFVPAGNESGILACLTTYFKDDTIKGAICGYKCITIYFENFKTQDFFITNLTELLNIPEINNYHTSGGTQA